MKYLLLLPILVGCSYENQIDRTGFAPKIVGHWQAEAFSGVLSEYWTLETDGWLLQQSYYIENQDTTYRANSRIIKTDEKWILYSVIENSNPKIFQSDIFRGDSLVFQNTEYSNPSRVIYAFISEDVYHRRISGIEEGNKVEYLFEFKRVD